MVNGTFGLSLLIYLPGLLGIIQKAPLSFGCRQFIRVRRFLKLHFAGKVPPDVDAVLETAALIMLALILL